MYRNFILLLLGIYFLQKHSFIERLLETSTRELTFFVLCIVFTIPLYLLSLLKFWYTRRYLRARQTGIPSDGFFRYCWNYWTGGLKDLTHYRAKFQKRLPFDALVVVGYFIFCTFFGKKLVESGFEWLASLVVYGFYFFRFGACFILLKFLIPDEAKKNVLPLDSEPLTTRCYEFGVEWSIGLVVVFMVFCFFLFALAVTKMIQITGIF